MNKCVFLDRDGVLNQDLEGYLWNPDLLEFPEGVAEGLKQLKQEGYLLIVITNQAGIAKGAYHAADVLSVHQRMQEAYGNLLDDLYFAPHHPEYSSRSLSRKPGSLLLEKAIAKYGIRKELSWMIGDRESDVKAGKNAGVRTILLSKKDAPTGADFRETSFPEATARILGEDLKPAEQQPG